MKPPSRQDIEKDHARVDADGDGCVTVAEFLAAHESYWGTRELKMKYYNIINTDGDGCITLEELLANPQTA